MAPEARSDSQYGEELIRIGGDLDYLTVLAKLAKAVQAQAYLEIGTFAGDSLAQIECPSIAVDPQLRIRSDVVKGKKVCLLFQMESDRFFDTYNPAQLLGRPLDLAFLDGLHLYEALLRDFINTEKYCHQDALIAMHDCLPPTFEMTTRVCRGATRNPKYLNYWTGDVWKIIPILRTYRPDLELMFIDCPPTGLVLARNLDPRSEVLANHYEVIIDRFHAAPDDFSRLRNLLKEIPLSPGAQSFSGAGSRMTPRRAGVNSSIS